ncbi:MAG: Gfo/Idh/MocA family oxidoreductase, partial [Planctomycetes bacterium]|nr:Gfo/Idh/MocA family oxidoreductase [Planctomycetota bacterium]
MKTLGVGIIGVGVGRGQAMGFLSDPRVGKVVLCDTDEAKLTKAAAELKVAEMTTDWRSLLGRDDLHVISVAAPDHLHPEMSIASLRAGKHVLCEKPMAPTLPEAREMLRAVRETGRKLAVNNVLRFYPRFQRVQQLVADGMLGRIYAAEGDYLHNTLDLIQHGWRGRFRHSVTTGGGVHLVDLLLWLIGDVDEAFGYASRAVLTAEESRSPECMLAVLRFRNGCVAKTMTNMAVQRPALHNLILYGTQGVFINARPDGLLYRGHKGEPELIKDAYGPATTRTGAKGVSIDNLLTAIERDEEPLVNVREGARAVAVCDAI